MSHKPEVADIKCGISILNIPHNQIHLVEVPELKSIGSPPVVTVWWLCLNLVENRGIQWTFRH